jgi:hypothetical protein
MFRLQCVLHQSLVCEISRHPLAALLGSLLLEHILRSFSITKRSNETTRRRRRGLGGKRGKTATAAGARERSGAAMAAAAEEEAPAGAAEAYRPPRRGAATPCVLPYIPVQQATDRHKYLCLKSERLAN